LDSRLLVDVPSSNEMLALLGRAQTSGPDPSFLTRSDVLKSTGPVSFKATHTKIGLGPLKPANGGFDVASEGTFIEHLTTGKRFIVVTQTSRNLIASLNELSRIVDRAIRLDLGLP